MFPVNVVLRSNLPMGPKTGPLYYVYRKAAVVIIETEPLADDPFAPMRSPFLESVIYGDVVREDHGSQHADQGVHSDRRPDPDTRQFQM